MKVRIINKSSFPLPEYATPLSAGMDLRANIIDDMPIGPLERKLVPTGLHGITVLNSPGTIDADYRGEIKVLLVNLSNNTFTIEPGERIAQMVVARHEHVQWESVTSLDETERGEGGFGSTGTE